MKKAIPLLLTLVLALSACSRSTSPTSGPAQIQTKDTIVYHLNAVPATLDPPWGNAYEWEVDLNIYDSLFRAPGSDYHNIIPWLVEKYDFSSDFLNMTCKLREGIRFHNGDLLTTADVVFTINSAKQSPLVMPALLSITEVEVVDDYNFVIKQSRPFPNLLGVLAGPQLGIKNKALYEQYGAHSRQAVVGTGPYKLVEWAADNNITLEYNQGYWAGEPKIKKVTFRPITDLNAATIAFEAGELDVFNWPLPTDTEHFIADSKYSHTVFYRGVNHGVTFNNQSPVFSNVNIRRAINHALDKESINLIVADGTYNTNVAVKSQAAAEGYANANIVKYEFNVERARQLLAAEGYNENNPLRATFLCTTSPTIQMFATAVQDSLAKANIILDVQPMEIGAWLGRLGSGDYEMSYAVWSFEYWWASILYYFNYGTGLFYNYEKIAIPEVDQMALAGMVEMDVTKRAGYYARLLNIVSDQAICAPVYQIRGVCLSTKGLVLCPDDANMISPVYDMYWDANH
jgi:peptide/nickel transport system substrate-binding protein